MHINAIQHNCHRIRVSTLQSSSNSIVIVVEIKCKYCKVETTLRKVLDLHLLLRNMRYLPRQVSPAIGNKYETKRRLSCGLRSITSIPSALFKNFRALSAYVALAHTHRSGSVTAASIAMILASYVIYFIREIYHERRALWHILIYTMWKIYLI